jgi:hypothetical protein
VRRPLALQDPNLKIATTTRTGSPIHHDVWPLLLATISEAAAEAPMSKMLAAGRTAEEIARLTESN